MKRKELNLLIEKAIDVVKTMPYGENTTTNRIVHLISPNVDLDFDELFEIENEIYMLDESNEMVLDKLSHFNKIQGLAYNLDFIKLENKGIPDNCCNKVEFEYSEGNFRRIIEGIIDFRTGRIVIYDAGLINNTIIVEVSEENRTSLVKLFPKDIFDEEEKEIRHAEIAVEDGIDWSVSVENNELGYRRIFGNVAKADDIPMTGAKELFKQINKMLVELNEFTDDFEKVLKPWYMRQ